jgi:branched-chain amino acid transport system substrate-binding protein
MDATGGPFAKQAKQLGLRAKVLAGDGVCTDKLSDLAGDATDNIVCSEAGMALEKMEVSRSRSMLRSRMTRCTSSSTR